MSEPRPGGSKRPRGTYSRLICLGCHQGELRTVQTPCYRCKRLGVPCIVRQTILGRPGPESNSTTAADFRPVRTGDFVSRIIIELPSRGGEAQVVSNCVILRTRLRSSNDLPPSPRDPACWNGHALLIHTPQSTETVIIIRAVDTLRCEKVEEEWFRHLPAHVGHTRALDLSIKAIVAACSYARGVPKLTSGDCYQALVLALNAVQANIKQSHGELNDDILASTALLAHFEGVIKKHGIPTRPHVEGLAAILAARPATYPVTQLAREIFDFHACDSAIMAGIQGAPSPFESIPRAYFANNRIGCSDNDRAQLKAIGSELFIRIPRLVGLVRSLRLQPSPQNQLLLDTLWLSKSLLQLEDSQAEERLLRNIKLQTSSNPDATWPLRRSLQFASVDDFEALTYYWQNRLSLLRLEHRLYDLSVSIDVQADDTGEPGVSFGPSFGPRANEMFRLVKNILMCAEYAGTLPLRKHGRLFAHAMVAVWGVAMDMPVALSHIQDGEGTGPFPHLLLRRVNTTLAAKPDLTAEDMDAAADIFLYYKCF
ncbi:uncharacterized protein BDR25DRAFT_337616 [Lindgomyces ingoldianus]|uniref:Uncharacterized protein n=1 Tax=Lindgomyces ingoldianus TaxID=673940 RepID=A0ACB6QAS5_9PLEO|nr:uncharacterized protein BDR25DRAFT_337616 [Lindgomyces ingoldianus]KAF2464012.1 hypothetical protein BDR25DRAFT_337616 [Lindgomyces ingoldianus]